MSADALSTGEAPVLFEERTSAGGKRIGFATLNAPKTLNGFSLEMAHLLDAKMQVWAADDAIALVVFQGAGEKAFCAGGDLHSLYRSMKKYEGDGCKDVRQNTYAGAFFALEYRLDYRIHTYAKPVLCWGHGIVMGGGIGLMAGASHRVVTERSKVAFPEISVGLYPDVGGSWLLNQVPDEGGLFLGLTGAPLNASDAIYANLADWSLAEIDRAMVFDALAKVAWSNDGMTAKNQLTELLQDFVKTPAEGPLQRYGKDIAGLCSKGSLDAIAQAIAALDESEPWLANAKKGLAAGAPSTARLTYELHRRTAPLSLADVLRLEYLVSLKCAAHGDFAEGIRAILIDKDRQPRWNPSRLSEATQSWIEDFFKAPWAEGDHPLADLGRGADTRRQA